MFDAAADEGDVLHFALNLLMVPDTMPSDKASPAPQNIAVGGTVTHEDTDSDDDKVTMYYLGGVVTYTQPSHAQKP